MDKHGESLTGNARRAAVETAVTVFVLGYGLHYFGYFLRARYFNWLKTLELSEGLSHCLGYLGHLVFLCVLLGYAWAVRRDRKYIFALRRGPALRNLKYALIGLVVGFATMGLCVLGAALNGNVTIRPASGHGAGLFLFAALCVLIQSAAEEIESRAFVFGKMHAEGVSLAPAVIVSSLFFSYLHAANPGFGLVPLLSIFVAGVLYALSYHYFGTLWFPCTAHMAWNYTQDFLFGLPDSGRPAAASIFSSAVSGSSFFYDQTFGIEGSWMAILVNALGCLAVWLIGRQLMKKKAQTP